MAGDALDLARIQFAFTVSFHILFPSFTIGLASYLAVLEALWLKTGREVFLNLYRFWVKVFALSFGMGVVSGVVMSYQFGTNWSVLSEKAGPILGPLLTYEVVTAFFLEAGFLGIMLFGMGRVGKGLHFTATLLVAVGTLISAFWILSANSWMQTPAGYVEVDGRFVPDNWWEIIFNPSFPYRLVHMVLAAFLTTAFAVGAVGAWHLLRDRRSEASRVMFSMALWMAAIVAPIQIFAGDQHGLNTHEHQPAKIAAIEGHWDNQKGAPFILVGWPDMEEEKTLWAVEIPYLGSFILTHDFEGEVQGLKDWPPEDRPNATVIFWTFRIMVAMGFAMFGLGLLSLWLRHRRRLYDTRWFLWLAVLMAPSGFIAILCGWVTTEMGRQPWVVYGLLRTADATSPVGAGSLGTTLAIFVAVYLLVFGAGFGFILRLIAKGPDDSAPDRQPPEPGEPASGSQRPMAAAGDAGK